MNSLKILTFLIFFCSIVKTKRHFHGIRHYYQKYGYPQTHVEVFKFKQSRLCPTNDGGPPYRYYKPARQCYLVGERGPCGEMMAFTLIDRDYGTCDCSQIDRCGRPLIYWPQLKRCYRVNDQGPCIANKWLTFGMYQTPVCKRNSCESQIRRDPSRGNRFWFERGGQCYRTGTQGYCDPGQVLVNQWEDFKPKCVPDDVSPTCFQNQVQSQACLPGMRHSHSTKCVANRLNGSDPEQKLLMRNIYHLNLE